MLLEQEIIVDEDHVYSQGGVICPRSATGLIKKYGLGADYSKIPPHIMEKARQRGKAVDVGFRMIAQGIEIDPASISPEIEPYLFAFRKFWTESGAELIECGEPRISPLGFGFETDIIYWLNGRRTIGDGKATFKLFKSVGPQTAFYKIGWNSLYPDQPAEDRQAIHLKKDGTYKAPILKDPDDEAAAMDILQEDIRRESADAQINKWRIKYGE